MFSDIEFESLTAPAPEDLLAFYARQRHRTSTSITKIGRMLERTFCFVTARRHGELIGVARGLTDGVWGCMVECKLDPVFQGPGCVTKTDGRVEHDSYGIAAEMARRLIAELHAYGVEKINVLAHGTEEDFCAELGFRRMSGVVPMELSADLATVADPSLVDQASS